MKEFDRKLKLSESPEIFFNYIIAVMSCNEYKERFSEFLKSDFPRIPIAEDFSLIEEVALLGKKLVETHLLTSSELKSSIAKFPNSGDNIIEKPSYDPETQRVYINNTQYFEGVESKVWNYMVGGYKVCEKWLKDRKGRTLSNAEILHYLKVVTAISKTIEIQSEIDEIYPLVDQNSVKIN